MTQFTANVTFEFSVAAPETFKGVVSASSPSTALSRALKAAQKAYPKRKWSSLVVVLERDADQAELM